MANIKFHSQISALAFGAMLAHEMRSISVQSGSSSTCRYRAAELLAAHRDAPHAPDVKRAHVISVSVDSLLRG